MHIVLKIKENERKLWINNRKLKKITFNYRFKYKSAFIYYNLINKKEIIINRL
jgi:hypothetical protein